MHYVETFETEDGRYRSFVALDEDPLEPEFDAGYPVLWVPFRHQTRPVRFTGYGQDSYDHDGINVDGVGGGAAEAMQQFVNRWGWSDGVDVFERWVAAFHGGKAYRFGNDSDGYWVAYSTAKMLKHWGHAPGVTTITTTDGRVIDLLSPSEHEHEYESYVDGDVYVIGVEVRSITTTTSVDWAGEVIAEHEVEEWVEDDGQTCHGYYGEEYAKREARSILAGYVKSITTKEEA